jgi:hypothetical protein
MQLYLGFYFKNTIENSTCFGRSPCPHCDVTTHYPGQPYRTLHFTSPHSYAIPTAAYAVMLFLMMGMVSARDIENS